MTRFAATLPPAASPLAIATQPRFYADVKLLAARARLDLQPSAALTPHLPITRYVLSVDGVRWAEGG